MAAFVPRVLKVPKQPVKKATRAVIASHATGGEVACRGSIVDNSFPHSDSTCCVPPAHNPTSGSEATQEGISGSGHTSPTNRPGSPVSKDGEATLDEDSDDEPVVSYCKDQRWPLPGEPVCVVCGRYGAYISDATEDDVCSLECKARAMHLKGLPLSATMQLQQQRGRKERSEGLGTPVLATSPPVGCNYRDHPDVASLSEVQVDALRTEVKCNVHNHVVHVCLHI